MTGRSSDEEIRTVRLWDKTNFLSSTLNTCSEFFLPKNLASCWETSGSWSRLQLWRGRGRKKWWFSFVLVLFFLALIFLCTFMLSFVVLYSRARKFWYWPCGIDNMDLSSFEKHVVLIPLGSWQIKITLQFTKGHQWQYYKKGRGLATKINLQARSMVHKHMPCACDIFKNPGECLLLVDLTFDREVTSWINTVNRETN